MKDNNLQQLVRTKQQLPQLQTAVMRSQEQQKEQAAAVLKQLANMYPQVNGVRRIPRIG
jgi:division protein CdvB (Snf7/Vps24/ESCRT-III family)